ncbi:peptide hydrolase [Favolaschia claudopus]|uniref:Peptide hydrolase n=1 Tax=Favolaschia claudopus TaxID=2862362 RepID=A0AAW0DB12_9AGAR
MPTVLRSSYKNRDPRDTHSRNPGRRDNFLWNSDAFICPHDVEGFRRDIRNATAATVAAAPAYDDAEDSVVPEQDSYPADAVRAHEVALMDIARYAKLKGVAKEYEVLDAPRRVIVLDEEAFSFLDDIDSDSEWEDLDAFSDAETSTAIAGPSKTRLGYDEEDDFALAKRLQDEEYARAGVPRPMARRVVSGGERKAYADVLVESNG